MRLARLATPEGPRFAVADSAGEWSEDLRWLDLGPATDGLQVALLAGERPPTGAELESPARLLAPIRPRRILAVGRNYLAHAQERSEQAPDRPIVFVKLSSAVIGPGEPVRIPPEHRDAVDYEGELAVVIGRPGRRLAEARALEHVAGYTVANDVTARDAQDRMLQWSLPKSLPSFAPLGPCLLTADELPDPQALSIETWVGGELRQRGETRDMIFPVAQLVSFISQFIDLEPGDVLETGTPAGTGWSQSPRAVLQPGQEVEVRIPPIGVLRNPVQLEQAALGD